MSLLRGCSRVRGLSLPSPTHELTFRGQKFSLKRDDLIHPVIGGNKARKLFFLFDYPKHIHTLVSFGSLHSNAMAALSFIAKERGWHFRYYAKLDQKTLAAPQGNLAYALENGMELRNIARLEQEWQIAKNLHSATLYQDGTLFVPEGARCAEAEIGIALLAKEIEEWAKDCKLEAVNIFLPSGTGTTALFLSKALAHTPHRVYTVPCVGDANYLQEQFLALSPDVSSHPTILEPPRKFRFGRLYRELYAIWHELKKNTGVTFDLLYDPVAFLTLLNTDKLSDKPLLYIHQGGLMGNPTMIARYKQKFGRI